MLYHIYTCFMQIMIHNIYKHSTTCSFRWIFWWQLWPLAATRRVAEGLPWWPSMERRARGRKGVAEPGHWSLLGLNLALRLWSGSPVDANWCPNAKCYHGHCKILSAKPWLEIMSRFKRFGQAESSCTSFVHRQGCPQRAHFFAVRHQAKARQLGLMGCISSIQSKTTCTHGLYCTHSGPLLSKKIQELAGPCYEALASLAVASTSAGLVVRYKWAHRLPRSTAAVSQRNWTAGSH